MSKQAGGQRAVELEMFDPKSKLPPTPDADTTVEYLCFCRDSTFSFWQVLEWDGEDFLLCEEPYTRFVMLWAELPEDPAL
jgi:hypothetical protein